MTDTNKGLDTNWKQNWKQQTQMKDWVQIRKQMKQNNEPFSTLFSTYTGHK